MARAKMKKKEQPKMLRGLLKQTEGYTPRESLAKGKEAGSLKRSAKRREKKLMSVPM